MSANLPSINATDSGMSVVELLIAVVILSLVASLALSRHKISGQMLVTTASRDLRTDLRYTRALAIARGEATTLVVDLKGKTYTINGRERRRDLAKELKLAITYARDAIPAADQPALMFFPDGSSTGGTVQISAGTARATVSVDWLSGAVSTSTP